jgi:hypothetical protein
MIIFIFGVELERLRKIQQPLHNLGVRKSRRFPFWPDFMHVQEGLRQRLRKSCRKDAGSRHRTFLTDFSANMLRQK